MPETSNIKKTVLINIFPLFFLLLAACAINGLIFHNTHQAHVSDDFVIVKTTAKDTFSSLAAFYLKDPDKGWLIAEFNRMTTLIPGQELIIPLSPFNKGGLKAEGYQTVPILVYHNFSKKGSDKTAVSQDDFEAQMKYLKQNGYHVVSIDQLLDFIDYKEQLPEKSIVITFDDAWRSIFDIALPILIKYGFTATFFIYTDFIGGGKAMTWKQIETLSKIGFDIQCQTKTHRNLAVPKKNESFKEYFESIEMEISYPKKLIKNNLNIDCKYLAYPYGETNNLVIAMLKKHGYRAAFTIDRKPNPFFIDKYRICRSVIYGSYDMNNFKNNLSVFQKNELK
ncbi:MAG: polysaccharide deacetylase family protein [Desulfobacteraceae bacterium]|nr:polysaccharide deacetylase family protein [Desulfobacteraceae bacterium]